MKDKLKLHTAIFLTILVTPIISAQEPTKRTSSEDATEAALKRGTIPPTGIHFSLPEIRGDKSTAAEVRGKFETPDFVADFRYGEDAKPEAIGHRDGKGVAYCFYRIPDISLAGVDVSNRSALNVEFGMPYIAERSYSKTAFNVAVWHFWNGKRGKACVVKELKIGFRSHQDAVLFSSIREGRPEI